MKLSHMVLMTGLIGLAACSGDERDIRLHELRSINRSWLLLDGR